MKKRTTKDEKEKGLGNKLAIYFVLAGFASEILVLVSSWGGYALTKNWTFIDFFIVAQLGIMPVVFFICSIGGISSSVRLLKRENNGKKWYLLTMVLSLLMIVFGMANVLLSLKSTEYRGESNWPNGGYQNERLMNRIENDYASARFQAERFNPLFTGKWWVDYCYGVYGDCVPVMMEGYIINQASREEEIGNIVIQYKNGNFITVWKNGKFYSLKEAYEKGFLSDEELKKIADIHNNVRNKT